jgi:type VI secretion system protein ImpK
MSVASVQPISEELTFLPVFDRFFAEVERLRRAAVVRPELAEDDMGMQPMAIAPGCDTIRQSLIRLLEEFTSDFGRHTESFEYQQFRQVLYVMTALADEIFINLDWDGRDEWSNYLLEDALFESHDAGDRFFDLLDDLLGGRDSAYRSVAVIYLAALSLGFQGKYRGGSAELAMSDEGAYPHILDDYRMRLYSFVHGERPGRRTEGADLCPQTTWYTVSGAAAEKFPSLRRWVTIGLLGLVIMLGISHGLWWLGTYELADQVGKILGEAVTP